MSYKKYVWRGGPPVWQLATGPMLDCHQDEKSVLVHTWGYEQMSALNYAQKRGVQRFKPEFVLQACLLLLRLGLGKCLELLEITETPVPEFNQPAGGKIPPVELKTLPAYVEYLVAEEKRRQSVSSRQSGGTSCCH